MLGKLALMWSATRTVASPWLLYIKLGVVAVVVAALVTYHLATVASVRVEEQIAGDLRCLQLSEKARVKAEIAYQLRAKRLQAQLEKQRREDAQAVFAADQVSQRLEIELELIKENGVAWTAQVVEEIQR